MNFSSALADRTKELLLARIFSSIEFSFIMNHFILCIMLPMVSGYISFFFLDVGVLAIFIGFIIYL